MTTTLAESDVSVPVAARRRPVDVFPRISELFPACRSATAFYRELLEILRDHFGACGAAMYLCNATESLNEHFVLGDAAQDVWQRLVEAVMLDCQADGMALARLYDVDNSTMRIGVLAVPLHDTQHDRGAVCLILHCPDRAHAERTLFQLRTLTAMACCLVSTVDSSRPLGLAEADATAKALSRAAKFNSPTELAFAITNGLKSKYQCDQVVLGQVTGRSVHLLSLSGMDALYPRSPGTRLIRQAMEECLDAGGIVDSQPGTDWSQASERRDYRLHQQWRSAIGDAAVASLPLLVGDRCVAVLSLVRPGHVGFRRAELDEVAQLAGAYAPALPLVARAHRGWWATSRDSLRERLAWFFARGGWGRRATAALLLMLAVWFCFGTWEYQLSNPCQLTPTRLQHCGAPFEGVVREAYVEAGDQVRQGQLLFRMDTRDLELERAQLQSEAAVRELEVSHAAARQDLEAAAMAHARLDVTRAQLLSVERRLELAEVRAPADGTIMAGDVKRRVGEVVPLGQSLLEFAPRGSWAVELLVPSRDAQWVRPEQLGQFVTLARPDQLVDCRVERIAPMATVRNGQTVFVARARVADAAAWKLAGMDGIATLQVGRRPVWWITLHRLIDFVRLHFWV